MVHFSVKSKVSIFTCVGLVIHLLIFYVQFHIIHKCNNDNMSSYPPYRLSSYLNTTLSINKTKNVKYDDDDERITYIELVEKFLGRPLYECDWMNQKIFEFTETRTHYNKEKIQEMFKNFGNLIINHGLKHNCIPYLLCGRTLCLLKEGTLCTTDTDIDVKYICKHQNHLSRHEKALKSITYKYGFNFLSDRFEYPDPTNLNKLCKCTAKGYPFLCHNDAFLDIVRRYGSTWYLTLPNGKGFLTNTDRAKSWNLISPTAKGNSKSKKSFDKYVCKFLETLLKIDKNWDGIITPSEVLSIINKKELQFFENNIADSARLLTWIYIWFTDTKTINRSDYWTKLNISLNPNMTKLKKLVKYCSKKTGKDNVNIHLFVKKYKIVENRNT